MLKKQIIGRNCLVSFKDDAQAVPARVGTGVSTSEVWASDIRIEDGILHFKLFAPNSEFFTNKEYSAQEYSVVNTTDASGLSVTKYKTKLSVTIDGRNIKTYFSLSDRENMRFPILIGRRTLRGNFLVDVEQDGTETGDTEGKDTLFSMKSLQRSPREFFRNYYQKKGKKK